MQKIEGAIVPATAYTGYPIGTFQSSGALKAVNTGTIGLWNAIGTETNSYGIAFDSSLVARSGLTTKGKSKAVKFIIKVL